MPPQTLEPRQKARRLPTLAETLAVERLVDDGFNELETLARHVEDVANGWEFDQVVPDEFPTHEHVGYLYLFAYYMDGRGDDLQKLAGRIRKLLPTLGDLEENVRLMRERESGDDGAQ